MGVAPGELRVEPDQRLTASCRGCRRRLSARASQKPPSFSSEVVLAGAKQPPIKTVEHYQIAWTACDTASDILTTLDDGSEAAAWCSALTHPHRIFDFEDAYNAIHGHRPLSPGGPEETDAPLAVREARKLMKKQLASLGIGLALSVATILAPSNSFAGHGWHGWHGLAWPWVGLGRHRSRPRFGRHRYGPDHAMCMAAIPTTAMITRITGPTTTATGRTTATAIDARITARYSGHGHISAP